LARRRKGRLPTVVSGASTVRPCRRAACPVRARGRASFHGRDRASREVSCSRVARAWPAGAGPSPKPESRTPPGKVELRKMKVELRKMKVELRKMKVELRKMCQPTAPPERRFSSQPPPPQRVISLRELTSLREN